MTPAASLEAYRAAILAAFPAHAASRFTLLTAGWDCVAVDVDDRLIYKFPRDADAEKALAAEASLLRVIRPAATLPVPDLTLHPGPPVFSRHAKLPGDHLVSAQYEQLTDDARQRLAADMARFYAELHALGRDTMAAAGAEPIEAWLTPGVILERTRAVLPPDLRAYAERTIAAWRDLPEDPHGITYGFFDGHGWNMAFDHATRTLNGIYDFGDSGFGALHQEFIYSNFIAPDLTARIITAYEAQTGRALDRHRIDLLTGVHRLHELAVLSGDERHAAMALGHVADWAAHHRRP
jgi:hypothetical protein